MNVLLFVIWVVGSLAPHGFADQPPSDQEPVQLPPISVTPGRFGIQEGTQILHELSREQMERFPLIDNDVYRAAQVFPGVVANDFSARFEVRGGDVDETLVRLDGLELYQPYHLQDFGGAISSVDLALVGRADLMTGGFPAAYGDRMSAVYAIHTRSPRRDRVHANLGLDLLNMHAILEGPLGKGSWLFSARRGYIDLILGLMGSSEDLNPRYTDFFLKLEQPLTDRDRLFLESLVGLDENEIHEEGTDLISNYRNRITWLRWRRLWDERLISDAFLFLGGLDQRKREGDFFRAAIPPPRRTPDLEGESDERHIDYLGVQFDLNAHWHPAHETRLGALWRLSDAFYDYFYRAAGDTEPIQANIDTERWDWDLRGYLQDEWQIHPQVAVNGGIRWLYQHENGSSVVSPRLALAVRPDPRWVFRAAWGLYHQPVDRLHIPVESGHPEVGDPEMARHVILSMEFQPERRTFLRLEGYYKPMVHLVGFIRDAGRKNQVFRVPDSGRAYGVEFFGVHRVSEQLSLSLAYAYSVARVSMGGQDFYRDSDQRHAIALHGNYAVSENTTLMVNWRFHTGNPYTESQFHLDPATGKWVRTYGEPNARRLPPYHSLDLRLTREAQYRRWRLQWYVQVFNLYNRKNLHEYAYTEVLDAAGRVIGYEKSEESLLPIVPTLGLSIYF